MCNRRSFENGREVPGQYLFNLIHPAIPAQLFERRDRAVGDAAGHDQVEEAKVGRNIQRKAMAGHPARNPHANGRQLGAPARARPDAGQPLDPSRVYAEIAGRTNQHFFEIAHITMYIAPIGTKVDDRISHELAGSVVRDVPAAPRLVNFDSALSEQLATCQDMSAPAVPFHTKCQDMRVLYEQEHVVDLFRSTLLDQLTLKRQRLTVRDQAETADN